uniref:Uncharacterized protein n=1 Tax=Anguilla anguilla TaxID=7936 RepID=A0A0E9PJA9_ANGAN
MRSASMWPSGTPWEELLQW